MKLITVDKLNELINSNKIRQKDKELWKSKKDEFFSQCNSEKDMGSYIHTDYCEEEYGIRMLEENIKEDTNNKEYGEIIQTWDEYGKVR